MDDKFMILAFFVIILMLGWGTKLIRKENLKLENENFKKDMVIRELRKKINEITLENRK